jgi:hypothetical protein
MVFLDESPRGNWLPICPFEKRTRWAGVLVAWNSAEGCPSINQIPVICQFVCEENESCIGWEMHCRGSGVLTKHRVEHTCEPCWRNNCEICTRHCQGSVRNRNLSGRGGDFWIGCYRPVCRLSSRCWEQGSYFAKSWRPRL